MNDEPEFVTVKKARKLLDITTPTLRKWSNQGKITAITAPSGMRRYNLQDIYNILGRDKVNENKEKILYCRVSSRKQSDDLERQVNFLRSLYPNHTVVTDIGSGLNWKRKGLQTILEQALSRNISELVVAHKDRLCRFGFELLDWLFKKCGVQLLVLESPTDQSSDTELAKDILSILHVYSCRTMGKRRYQSKKDKTETDTEPETDPEEVGRNC
jgi:putative resolvase